MSKTPSRKAPGYGVTQQMPRVSPSRTFRRVPRVPAGAGLWSVGGEPQLAVHESAVSLMHLTPLQNRGRHCRSVTRPTGSPSFVISIADGKEDPLPQGRSVGQSSSQKGWSQETPHPNRKTRPERMCSPFGLPVPSSSSLETRGKPRSSVPLRGHEDRRHKPRVPSGVGRGQGHEDTLDSRSRPTLPSGPISYTCKTKTPPTHARVCHHLLGFH